MLGRMISARAHTSGIELAVVSHGGIDDLQSPPPSQGVEDVLHILDLLGAAQIAGVEGVKGDALLLPVGGDFGHILGEIAEGVAGEAGGVGREHRRGQNGGLHAAGGENGQRHREGALTHTGDILNG